MHLAGDLREGGSLVSVPGRRDAAASISARFKDVRTGKNIRAQEL